MNSLCNLISGIDIRLTEMFNGMQSGIHVRTNATVFLVP